VLTPLQEGQLEASSYPWCPDVWAIAGAAAAAQAAAANAAAPAEAAGTGRGKGGRKAAAAAVKVEPGAGGQGALNEDPLAALSMGTDVLQPLMPFMTGFQLLREPITAKGAGLRLKRESVRGWLVRAGGEWCGAAGCPRCVNMCSAAAAT
jgi:hypothetical protein